MYNVYYKEGAEHQVNLPWHMRTDILEKILLPHYDDDEGNDDDTNNTSIDETLFTSAQNEIYKFTSGDNYARFQGVRKASIIALTLLCELRCLSRQDLNQLLGQHPS